MKKIVFTSLLAIFSICASQAQKSYKSFGESFSPSEIVPAKILTSTEKASVEVKGTVEAVCPVKGCWMKLKLDNGQTMRVTFKDYGFFVPKDMPSGTSVIIKGKPEIQVTSVKELKHYAQDAGKSKSEIAAINRPLEELTFVADGVLVAQ
ncbi:DUF4920 domain-containing protein [Marinilongibacter aquaticus]|uniref:DUF4920 domain-containing protein n=1 Tax=Marinilongibacter aquaticus TaxID=2975157 RepID=UPI0021BD2949|nr:DUF4920 domain-containing protein [Marinilongibacter aquaticus]UBM59367.1 DUF4920 domain-containing protein [Marinilongibacter aquaticus]